MRGRGVVHGSLQSAVAQRWSQASVDWRHDDCRAMCQASSEPHRRGRRRAHGALWRPQVRCGAVKRSGGCAGDGRDGRSDLLGASVAPCALREWSQRSRRCLSINCAALAKRRPGAPMRTVEQGTRCGALAHLQDLESESIFFVNSPGSLRALGGARALCRASPTFQAFARVGGGCAGMRWKSQMRHHHPRSKDHTHPPLRILRVWPARPHAAWKQAGRATMQRTEEQMLRAKGCRIRMEPRGRALSCPALHCTLRC